MNRMVRVLMLFSCMYNMHNIMGMEFGKKVVKRLSPRPSLGLSIDFETLDLEKYHNACDEYQNTPLIYAVQNNKTEMVTQLLTYKTLRVNVGNQWGNTALHCAAINGNKDILLLLLNDSRINATSLNHDKEKAIDCLSKTMDNYENVRNQLIKNELLHQPQYENIRHFKIEECIKEAAINEVDAYNTSVLIWSIWSHQDISLIKQLLSHTDININHRDNIFGTALHYAALFAQSDVVELLLLNYRTDETIHNNYTLTPHACVIKPKCFGKDCSCPDCFSYDKIRNLLFSRTWISKIVQKHVRDVPEPTGCFLESIFLKDELISEIIKKVKDQIKTEAQQQQRTLPKDACLPDYVTDEFLSDLIQDHYQKYSSYLSIDFETLDLEKHHNSCDKHKNTPLIYAVQNNKTEMVTQLLAYKTLRVNAANEWGNTALHCAAMNGNKDIILLLLNDSRTNATSLNHEKEKAIDCLSKTMDNYENVRKQLIKNELLHQPQYRNMRHFKIEECIKEAAINEVDAHNTSVLIWSIWSHQDISLIKQLLSYADIDINHRDSIFGTALHYAVLFAQSDVVELLLSHYRTDETIHNNYTLTPHACVIKPECFENDCSCADCLSYYKIRNLLFSRTWINKIIQKHVHNVPEPKRSSVESIFLSKDVIDKIIKKVRTKITKKTQRQQKKLTKDAYLLDYITDDFLSNLIQDYYQKRFVKF